MISDIKGQFCYFITYDLWCFNVVMLHIKKIFSPRKPLLNSEFQASPDFLKFFLIHSYKRPNKAKINDSFMSKMSPLILWQTKRTHLLELPIVQNIGKSYLNANLIAQITLASGVISVTLLYVQVIRESEEKGILLWYQRLGQNGDIQNLPKDNIEMKEPNNVEVKNNDHNTKASEEDSTLHWRLGASFMSIKWFSHYFSI